MFNKLWQTALPMLTEMNVPDHRLQHKDYKWLLCNLSTNNSIHPNFIAVMEILQRIEKSELREQVIHSGKLMCD